MHGTNSRSAGLLASLCALVSLQASAADYSPPAKPEHIRGTIESLKGEVLTVATASGPVRVRLSQSTPVATAAQSDRAHITDGSFLGITSVTAADGSQRAVEVHVFPEAMRGTGEGSYGWDWPGAGASQGSKMTNGTAVTSKMTNGTVTAREGGSLTLQYKGGASGGSQAITIPPGIPVVAIEPGRQEDLQAGAHVFVIATRDSEGALTANRVLAGKNGVVPPM